MSGDESGDGAQWKDLDIKANESTHTTIINKRAIDRTWNQL
jgi:hypothetical protein